MKKAPYVKAPAEFPVSRSCRIRGGFLLITSAVAAVAVLALISWFGLLLLDENAVVDIPHPVRKAATPVVWAGLGVLAVLSVLIAILRSSWAAAGRRDLYRAASGEFEHKRPTDRQMRWFLRDANPWEAAAVTILVWACLGTLAGGVAAVAIHFGGRADDRPLGNVMLVLALVSAVTAFFCIRAVGRLEASGLESMEERERLWPLLQDSDLRASLRWSTGGGSSDVTVL